MSVVIFLVLIILSILLLVFFINNSLSVSNMLWHFKHCNVLVGGAKGRGKDCLFDYVIKKRKDFYYANIDYSIGNKIPRKIIGLKDVSVYPNTYRSFVNEDYTKIERKFFDGKDIYLSDIGNFLPSYKDAELYKLFPSMPIYYSLSRHLYANNVHCNSQNIERGWKAIREQAEFFVICKRTYKIFGWLITKCYSYDKIESAKQCLKPLKKRMFNKVAKANYDLYQAQNGDIRKFYIFQRVKSMSYDTRAFEKFIFDSPRLIYNKRDYQCPNVNITENTTDKVN